MRVITLTEDVDLEHQLVGLNGGQAAWVLLYGVQGMPFLRIMNTLRRRQPNLPIFGATSFRGVFTERGFIRGAALLIADREDEIVPAVALEECAVEQARERARTACRNIERQLAKRPNMLLLHATPGFEEAILAGVQDAFGNEVPVYGGSAADDSLAGRWQVFANGAVCAEGFLLIGLESQRPPSGGFLGGYLPTQHSGTVTRATGRVVYEIDGKPAAAVYNAWTDGAISAEVAKGGSVMDKTNLLPLARKVGKSSGLPRRLLAHPKEVMAGEGALSFFAEFSRGDEVTLMTSTRGPLVSRVRRAVQRARGTAGHAARGALLIYCAGCLGIMLNEADRIAHEFGQELGRVPFVGIATFGEQGTFFEKAESLHGNLMCSSILF